MSSEPCTRFNPPPRRHTISGVRRRDTGEGIESFEAIALPPVRRRSATPPGSPGPGFVGTCIDLPALQWDTGRRLALFQTTCRLVAAIHAAGEAHGQLWPGAVLLTDELEPHVERPRADVDSAERKPAYFAPEMRDGGPATVAADVFGLGRLLWFMATDGAEVEPSLARLAAQTAGMAAVVRRACAIDPASRHGSVAELLAHLDAELARAGTHDRHAPTENPRSLPKPRKRAAGRLTLGFAALVALAVALFGWMSVTSDRAVAPADASTP